MKKSQLHFRCHKNMRGFSLVELLIVSTVLLVVLGIISGIVQAVQRSYARERPRIEAVNNATAALDTIVRIVRMAGNNPNSISNFPSTTIPAIVPGANSIRIRADWNLADGVLNGPYEDVEFTVAGGVLQKQERSLAVSPDTAGAVLFLENIESLSFTYRDSNNVVTANGNLVAFVDIVLTTRTPDGIPMTFSSSVSVRRMEP